jgi:hypothetical protein
MAPPSFQLAKDPEDLLRRALLNLAGHGLSRPAAEPLAEPEGGSPSQPDRQGR